MPSRATTGSLNPCHVRIAIVDDHPIFRDALKCLFKTVPEFDIVAEGTTAADAVRIVRDFAPDVLLLDYVLPDRNGVEAMKAFETKGTRVILLTAAMPATNMLAAIQSGAHGVVFKHAASRSLIDAVHRVAEGRHVFGDEAMGDLLQTLASAGSGSVRRFKLTPRELQIVTAIADGMGNAEIARQLGISVQTVKHHITSIFSKTGVSSRLALAVFAIDKGLASSDRAR